MAEADNGPDVLGFIVFLGLVGFAIWFGQSLFEDDGPQTDYSNFSPPDHPPGLVIGGEPNVSGAIFGTASLNFTVSGPLSHEDWCDPKNAETSWKMSQRWYNDGLSSIGPGHTEVFSEGKIHGESVSLRIFTGTDAMGDKPSTDFEDKTNDLRMISVEEQVAIWYPDDTYGWMRNHHPGGPMATGFQTMNEVNRNPLYNPLGYRAASVAFEDIQCIGWESQGESRPAFRFDMSHDQVEHIRVVDLVPNEGTDRPGPIGPLFMSVKNPQTDSDYHEIYVHYLEGREYPLPHIENPHHHPTPDPFLSQLSSNPVRYWDSDEDRLKTYMVNLVGDYNHWVPIEDVHARVLNPNGQVVVDVPLEEYRQDFGDYGWIEYLDRDGNSMFNPGDRVTYEIPMDYTFRLWDERARDYAQAIE